MLSTQELATCLEIGLIYGIAAIGIYLAFTIINFPDLTCDGSFVLGAVVSSVIIKYGYDPYSAAVASIIACGLAGLLTGILNIYLKIEDLLSGIIVAFMLYSISLRVMNFNSNIALMDETTIFSGDFPLIKIAAILIFLAAVFGYVLMTDFGLGLRTVGKNKTFASICGINANAMTIVGLIASNSMIGMCGALFAQYQGFCDVSQGAGTMVIGLASVIIGKSILPVRSNVIFEVAACVIGSVIYRIFIAFAIHGDSFGLKTQDLNFITGIMIIAITYFRRKNAAAE